MVTASAVKGALFPFVAGFSTRLSQRMDASSVALDRE